MPAGSPSAGLIASLADRAVVSVRGSEAAKFLQGLITNDIDGVRGPDTAIHAGLLSPQGKILFDFLIVGSDGGYLLDVARDKAADLVRRLQMYKLRADISVDDLSGAYRVFAMWGGKHGAPSTGAVAYADPRHPELGLRILANRPQAESLAAATSGNDVPAGSYHSQRVAFGVPEGGKDYTFGDTFPHEANFDLLHGVSFTKGCFVGQEVVARMQNKSVVRKRVVRLRSVADLVAETDVMFGDVPIGRIGTVDGLAALALLRLDRAVEAQEKGVPLTAGGAVIEADGGALRRYADAAAKRAAAAGPAS